MILNIKNKLSWLLPDITVLLYKAWDQIPYDNISPSKEIQTSRLDTLFHLSSENQSKIIILTTLNAIIQKTLPKNEITKNFITISRKSKIKIDKKDLTFVFRKKRSYLPFELKLKDFKKKLHPGTDIPKSFSSNILLIDKEISRPVLIKMNEPLRYKGYTFYQSSFNEGPDVDTTILAVVKNHGRLFPYISSLTISLGLLIHMFLKFPIIFSRRRRK